MFTKKYVSSYIVNGGTKKGCDVARNGQKYVTLLITSNALQDRGTHVTSFNPKDIAKCTDGQGNFLPNEVIDSLAEETVENYEKMPVQLDGIYYRYDGGNIVINEKTGRPQEYTEIKVGVMWEEHWDYLFIDGKPFLTPSASGTYEFQKFPICDPATGRPKRFYQQGWSPEERVASLIEAGFYAKADKAAAVVNMPSQAPQTAVEQAAEAALAAAQQAPAAPATPTV